MTTETRTAKRLISIDILKAIAVILILNHRLQISYGEFSILATGGAIGCAFFFFVSGYALGCAKVPSFKAWLQRRLSRLIPTIVVIGFVAHFGIHEVFGTTFLWFVHCIVIYYILFFFIKRYIPSFMIHLEIVLGIIYAAGFLLDWHSLESPYGSTFTKWFLYFLFFLAGAIVRQQNLLFTRKQRILAGISAPLLLSTEMLLRLLCQQCIISNYCLLISPLLLLMGVVTLFAALTTFDASSMQSATARLGYPVVAFVAALSLESYIGLGPVSVPLQTLLLPLFPLNIPLVMVALLGFCYLLRVCTRLFLALLSGQEDKLSCRYIFASFM